LTAQVEAIEAPPRRCRRVALIGAHGGAGTSCLAVALARRMARSGGARLAALNQAGAPVGALLGLAGGSSWAAAAASTESPLAIKQVAGIEVLSPAGPEEGVTPWQVRQTIEAWEEQSPARYTVFDAANTAPLGGWRIASWAEAVVIVLRGEPAGLAAAEALLDELRPLGVPCHMAVREVRGGLRAWQVGQMLDRYDVVRIGAERQLVAGLTHGLSPGDRPAGPLAAAAGTLVGLLDRPTGKPSEEAPVAADPAWPVGEPTRRHSNGWRRPTRPRWRAPAPGFNPAAFAEEW
jgi:hypothetical protein